MIIAGRAKMIPAGKSNPNVTLESILSGGSGKSVGSGGGGVQTVYEKITLMID